MTKQDWYKYHSDTSRLTLTVHVFAALEGVGIDAGEVENDSGESRLPPLKRQKAIYGSMQSNGVCTFSHCDFSDFVIGGLLKSPCIPRHIKC